MNKQFTMVDGKKVNTKIEWCDYTWNPIKGCFHACQWTMPNGEIANCYAEDVAKKFTAPYPEGFEHHYWSLRTLNEPSRVKEPAKIFWGSMADNFGHWVPREQLLDCFAVIHDCPQHTFQALTKNPRRMAQMSREIPNNVWCGASSPPDFMHNKPMTPAMQEAMLERTMFYLAQLHRDSHVTWMSAEPLSWDITPIIKDYFAQGERPLDWVVIGAASNGRTYYPPRESDVRALVELCDQFGVKVFFKGNLKSLPWAAAHWREEFPR